MLRVHRHERRSGEHGRHLRVVEERRLDGSGGSVRGTCADRRGTCSRSCEVDDEVAFAVTRFVGVPEPVAELEPVRRDLRVEDHLVDLRDGPLRGQLVVRRGDAALVGGADIDRRDRQRRGQGREDQGADGEAPGITVRNHRLPPEEVDGLYAPCAARAIQKSEPRVSNALSVCDDR